MEKARPIRVGLKVLIGSLLGILTGTTGGMIGGVAAWGMITAITSRDPEATVYSMVLGIASGAFVGIAVGVVTGGAYGVSQALLWKRKRLPGKVSIRALRWGAAGAIVGTFLGALGWILAKGRSAEGGLLDSVVKDTLSVVGWIANGTLGGAICGGLVGVVDSGSRLVDSRPTSPNP